MRRGKEERKTSHLFPVRLGQRRWWSHSIYQPKESYSARYAFFPFSHHFPFCWLPCLSLQRQVCSPMFPHALFCVLGVLSISLSSALRVCFLTVFFSALFAFWLSSFFPVQAHPASPKAGVPYSLSYSLSLSSLSFSRSLSTLSLVLSLSLSLFLFSSLLFFFSLSLSLSPVILPFSC